MLEEYNILISSIGGQGGVTLARVISRAAFTQGYRVRVGETLGMAQRGGSVESHVRFGERVYGPLIPYGSCDVLLSLEPAEALRASRYIGRKTKAIVNTVPRLPISVQLKQQKYPATEEIASILKKLMEEVYLMDAVELAERAGSAGSMNIAVLGAYMALEGNVLKIDSVKEAMATSLPSRFMKQNTAAFELGMERMRELMEKG